MVIFVILQTKILNGGNLCITPSHNFFPKEIQHFCKILFLCVFYSIQRNVILQTYHHFGISAKWPGISQRYWKIKSVPYTLPTIQQVTHRTLWWEIKGVQINGANVWTSQVSSSNIWLMCKHYRAQNFSETLERVMQHYSKCTLAEDMIRYEEKVYFSITV